MGGILNSQSQLALVLVFLFLFNMARGIASCAWFPWIRGLIPENIRGAYLTSESAFANAGSLIAFLLVALYLGEAPKSFQFSYLFIFSCLAGGVSLIFISRVPDVLPPEEEKGKKQQAPWIEIFGNKSKNQSLTGTNNFTVPSSKGRAINAVVLAFLRFLKARKIVKRSEQGELILVDRWPTNEIGKISSGAWFLTIVFLSKFIFL